MADIDLILSEFKEIKELLKARPVEQSPEQPEIINADEICKRLDISGPTLIKWRQKKKIPFIKIGSSIRYNWPAVINFLQSKSGSK